jgi:hypothetical protein
MEAVHRLNDGAFTRRLSLFISRPAINKLFGKTKSGTLRLHCHKNCFTIFCSQ